MGQFNSDQVNTLVQNLVQGEADLTAKTQANADAVKQAQQSIADAQAALTKAQSDAADTTAKAAGDLQGAQATNRANVTAIKQYFASLDDQGDEPDPTGTDSGNAGTGASTGTTPINDTGTGAGTTGDPTSPNADNPANDTSTPPSV